MMPSVRLLLVDDDRLVLATLAMNLRSAGYEVEVADSGDEALEVASSARFNLAVLDIRMPGMSGIETAERLCVEHAIPAMFLSAYGDSELVQQAVNGGGLGYVIKPVDANQLVPAIEAALARARDLAALIETKHQLERALAGGRHTNVAIGVLMERRRITEAAAFEILRNDARRTRRKLEDYASNLVAALDRQNLH
jgi:AmiR/NasT family two-component response regulator